MSNSIFLSLANCQEFAKNATNAIGVELHIIDSKNYSNGELKPELKHHVRGKNVFIFTSTATDPNNKLVELLLLTRAVKNSSAEKINVVFVTMGYSRDDNETFRSPLAAKWVADMLKGSGTDSALVVDLHSEESRGFFDIPIDNVNPYNLYMEDIKDRFNLDEIVLVSPDIGGARRVENLASQMEVGFAVVSKVFSEVLGDVAGRKVIIIDDMLDTAKTFLNATIALKKAGAVEVHGYCTHAILSTREEWEKKSSVFNTLTVSDSIPLRTAFEIDKRINVISLARLTARVIRQMDEGSSIDGIISK